MNDNLKIIIAVILTAVICIAGSAVVFGGDAENANKKQTLVVTGSTTVQPLMNQFQESFEEYANISMNVTGGGSSAGASAVLQKTADIGMMSRDPKQAEIEGGLEVTVIGMDAVVVIVSKDAGVNNLTVEDIAKIYSGIYTNWKELGGNDKKINPIVREEGSGTRDCIEEALAKALEGYETSNSYPAEASTGSMKTRVENTSGAIGYVSLSAASDLSANTVTVAVNGVEASVETVSNGEYSISRNLILVTNGEPTGMSAFFLSWVLSPQGQKIVEDMGFIKIISQ